MAAPNIHIQTGCIPVILIDNLGACSGPCSDSCAWDCYWSHVWEDNTWHGPKSCWETTCVETEAIKIRKAQEPPIDYLDREIYSANDLPFTTGWHQIAGNVWKFDIYREGDDDFVVGIYTDTQRKIDISGTRLSGEAWFTAYEDEDDEAVCKSAWQVLRRVGVIW